MILSFPPSVLNKDLVKALIRITELQTYISRHEEIQGVTPGLEVEYIWAQKLGILYDYLVPYYLTGITADITLENAVMKLRRIIKATDPYALKRERKDLCRPEDLVPLPEKQYEMVPLEPDPAVPLVIGRFKKSMNIGKFLVTSISQNGQRLSSQLVIDSIGDFTEYGILNDGSFKLNYEVRDVSFDGEDYIEVVVTGHNLAAVAYINVFTYTQFITDNKQAFKPNEGFDYQLPLIFVL
jgi:hypothetical protein